MAAIVRTFHPVGFGAFYTEVHTNGNNTMTIVYDCGTKTRGVDIEKCIKRQFPRANMVIDILFISHFHEDHISGINFLKSHCRIKKVIIPYIPKVNRTLFVFAKELQEYNDLIVNTNGYFGGDTDIVRIASQQGGLPQISDQEEIRESGNPLHLPSNFPNWHLIPFNFDYDHQVSTLINELRKEGLDHSKLADEEYIKTHIEKIKAVYKSLFKGNKQNEISLTLFSGCKNNRFEDLCFFRGDIIYLCSDNRLNCLYLGDASLKKSDFMDSLRKRLGLFYETINTIQIPHHGSKNNFKKEILNPGSFSVISCDYKHYDLPSPSVVSEICKAGSLLMVVTEDKDTEFTEIGLY